MFLNMKIKIFALFAVLFSSSVMAGESLTSEYTALRKEVYEDAHKQYRECINSLSDPIIEEAYNNCVTEGRYHKTADGCIHEASSKAAKILGETKSLKVCDQFALGKEEIKNRINQLAKDRNIKKYK